MRIRPLMIVPAAFAAALLFFPAPAAAGAGEPSVLEGRVVDTRGLAAEGAMVFLYSSPDVRRSADFISNRVDADGRFRVVLPAGRYWSVARLKKGEDYGPLMRGDKHSGDPQEVELDPGATVHLDFTVADLQDAIRSRAKDRERAARITGKVLTGQGAPAAGVYAIANRTGRVVGIPDYLSLGTDADGSYVLYLPKGKYYLGAASLFPPGPDYTLQGQITVEGDKAGVDIIWNEREKH